MATVAATAAVLAGCGPHPAATETVAALGPFVALDMVDASHGWALTAKHVVTTASGGQAWAAVSTPAAGLDPGRLALLRALSPTTAWTCEPGRWRGAGPEQAAGDYLFQRLLPDRCYVTSDGGHTWTAHDVGGTGGMVAKRDKVTQTLTWLAPLDASHALAVLRSDRAHVGGGQESDILTELSVIRTDDGGASWTTLRQRHPQQDGTPDALAAPRLVMSRQDAWLVGFMPGEFDRSEDGGRTWTAVPLPASPRLGDLTGGMSLGTPSVSGESTVTIPVFSHGPDSVRLLYSNDGGATWTVSASHTCTQLCSDVSAPVGDGWAVTDGGKLLVTPDLGNTWTDVAPPKPYETFLDVDMLTPRLGWTLVRNESGTTAILATRDGGVTWASPS